MFVISGNPKDGPYYTLVKSSEDGGRDRLAEYGKEKPTYIEPDMRLGLCEKELKTLSDGEVDLLVDDPPYGTTNAEWDTEPNWTELAEEFDRVLADDGQVVVFGKQPSLIPVFNAFTDGPFEFRFELIWNKQNNPWVSNQQPIPIHENIFVFKKSAAKVGDLTFNTEDIRRDGVFVCPKCEEHVNRGSYSVPRGNERKSETQGGWQEEYEGTGGEDRYPISFIDRDVLEFTSVGGWSDEYTGYAGQKPIDLLSWIVTAMSDRGDTVLDPHMGSASTQMACIPLCRRSIGFEADANRFQTAEERVSELIDDLRGLKHGEVLAAENWINSSQPEPCPADD